MDNTKPKTTRLGAASNVFRSWRRRYFAQLAFLSVVGTAGLLPGSAFSQDCRGVYSKMCAGGGGGSGGSGMSIWDLFRSPEPTIDPQQENRNIARTKNTAGIEAWNRGDFASAVTLFEEATRLWPEDPNIAENLRRAREQLQAQREEEQRRAGMQQGLNRMADILNNMQPAVTSGLNFDGALRTPAAGPASDGLDFMPATPTNETASAPKPPDGFGCGVNTDASVVDLCGTGDRLVVDPAKLKAPVAVASAPQAPAPSAAAAKREIDRQLDDLLASMMLDRAAVQEFDRKYDETMSRYLFDMMQPSRWPGPTNPNPRLINPLNEPERYEAWKKSIDARLRIQAQEGKNASVVERMSRDPGINAARDRIVKKQEEAEGKAFSRAQQDMIATLEKLRKEAKLKDFAEFQNKEQQDPNFKARVNAARDAIVRRWEREEGAARSNALREMIREVDNWQSAQTSR